MKLIDKIMQETNDSKEYILDCACPSDYGPEYDEYDHQCGKFKNCEECWQQEVD